MNATPKTAAEINARRSAIGAELAKGRMAPIAGARELEAEEDRLRIEYREALNRESEDARIATEVARRIESARAEKLAAEREARIKQAVAEATR